jgi:putative restriction endonuclease
MRFLVSRAIRDEFENGRDYYALDGTTVRDTLSLEARPAKEHLEWHASERFKG